MSFLDYVPGRHRLYKWMFGKGMRAILGDGDVVCLIPYADGVLVRKRGHYEKNLIGNMAGYKTADGDKFIFDGDGDAIFSLHGVPVVMCVDPSQMAAVAHPLKALIGQRADIGEYVRVDRNDNVVSRGKALERVDGENPAVADESPLAVSSHAHDELYDLSPPARLTDDVDADAEAVADGGAALVEQADGFVVSANRAADLVPQPVTNRELEIMQQRERNAAWDASKWMKAVGLGAIIGAGSAVAGIGIYAAASGLL